MQKKCRGFGSEGILRKEKSVHSPLLKITAFEHRDYQTEAAFSRAHELLPLSTLQETTTKHLWEMLTH